MDVNEASEYTVILDGPARFLDVVFETIDARIDRTGEEYAEIITGVDAVDAGDVDHEEEAVVHLYVLGDVPPDEAREQIDLELTRIADEHSMTLARENVRLTVEDGEVGEEE